MVLRLALPASLPGAAQFRRLPSTLALSRQESASEVESEMCCRLARLRVVPRRSTSVRQPPRDRISESRRAAHRSGTPERPRHGPIAAPSTAKPGANPLPRLQSTGVRPPHAWHISQRKQARNIAHKVPSCELDPTSTPLTPSSPRPRRSSAAPGRRGRSSGSS